MGPGFLTVSGHSPAVAEALRLRKSQQKGRVGRGCGFSLRVSIPRGNIEAQVASLGGRRPYHHPLTAKCELPSAGQHGHPPPPDKRLGEHREQLIAEDATARASSPRPPGTFTTPPQSFLGGRTETTMQGYGPESLQGPHRAHQPPMAWPSDPSRGSKELSPSLVLLSFPTCRTEVHNPEIEVPACSSQ